ncbi:MAG: enoyl-CoA hydratase-related protein [Spirochaetota bacterium]|nr:enoyl-CoA hydratase-related protein [Spirochaetota bacterium]
MTIHYKVENHIAEITLDRQDVRNAMDLVTIEELGHYFLDIRNNPDIWVAIITGSGDKAFCSGADIAKLPAQLAEAGKSLIEAGYKNIMFGFEVYKPLIAAVNGLCLGGGFELAMACDFRIASDNASFGLVEPKIGAIPSAGGTQRLTRLVPLGTALEMMFTAKRIDAQEACRIGLVNRVVSLDELMPTVRQIAEQICQNAPLAVRGVKEAALKGLEMHLRDGLALEAAIAERLGGSEDIMEGFKAFLEKRKPDWKGK